MAKNGKGGKKPPMGRGDNCVKEVSGPAIPATKGKGKGKGK
jgi:hypothetical protein